MSRSAFGPRTCTVASSAASATHMSDGLVAMQDGLVPRIASERLAPSIASQPEPGARLLQRIAVSRKYMQRVRCRRFPAVVAMLRKIGRASCRERVEVADGAGG